MKTSKWIAIIGLLVVFMFSWELNQSDELGVVLWAGYVALSILVFTAAWVTLTVLSVVWLCRLAGRGYEAEQQDSIKAAQARIFRFGNN